MLKYVRVIDQLWPTYNCWGPNIRCYLSHLSQRLPRIFATGVLHILSIHLFPHRILPSALHAQRSLAMLGFTFFNGENQKRVLTKNEWKWAPCSGNHEMMVSINMGSPKWMVFKENPVNMDENWGYPYFRKPPNSSWHKWASKSGRPKFYRWQAITHSNGNSPQNGHSNRKENIYK